MLIDFDFVSAVSEHIFEIKYSTIKTKTTIHTLFFYYVNFEYFVSLKRLPFNQKIHLKIVKFYLNSSGFKILKISRGLIFQRIVHTFFKLFYKLDKENNKKM